MFIRTLALVALTAASTSGALGAVKAMPRSATVSFGAPAGGVIGGLNHITTIGSTVDPLNGDQNPYGLAISPATGGMISKGDLVVCNFNDSTNIQGLGTTIEILKPVQGSKPVRLISDPHLTGCSAIAMGSDFPWAAAYDANDNPVVASNGTIVDPIDGSEHAWLGPWGQAFGMGMYSKAAFYESNANDGSITRINLTNPFTFTKIASGFKVNHGMPGGILAPSGLTYDANRDVLYVVDGASNRVVALHKPGKLGAGAIAVTPYGFVGPQAGMAEVVFDGSPLNAPISAALLFNGDLVVGNTGNNNLIELAPGHGAVGMKTLDKGVSGALFGIAAAGTSAANTKIYFNDDNDNTVKLLSK